MYQEGFYRFEDTLFYAKTFVQSSDYQLVADAHDTYTYPVHGWYWFDSLAAACEFWNLNPQDYLPQPEETQTSWQ